MHQGKDNVGVRLHRAAPAAAAGLPCADILHPFGVSERSPFIRPARVVAYSWFIRPNDSRNDQLNENPRFVHPERVADVSPGQARRRGGRRPGSGPPRERHPERVREYWKVCGYEFENFNGSLVG